MQERFIRVLIAKPGLDGHDRGAKLIALALRNAGMEVIYTGLRVSPEIIVSTAIDEDVDVIGLSILSGAHMILVQRVMKLLRQRGARDKAVVIGGTIPRKDFGSLRRLGVSGIFSSGSRTEDVVDFIKKVAKNASRS